MKTCFILNCTRDARVQGLCQNHYIQLKLRGRIGKPKNRKPKKFKCKIPNCNTQNHYAKGYCWIHYAKYISGSHRAHQDNICAYPNCNKSILTSSKYCGGHQNKINYRIKKNLPLNLSIDYRGISLKGKNNYNWKGGIAEYPNHSEMKRIRKQKLKSVNYRCEICGAKAKSIHHLDGTKYNHALDNIIAVCYKCHARFHPQKHTSKFRKLYGITLKEMSDKYDKPIFYFRKLHQQGLLSEYLTKRNEVIYGLLKEVEG